MTAKLELKLLSQQVTRHGASKEDVNVAPEGERWTAGQTEFAEFKGATEVANNTLLSGREVREGHAAERRRMREGVHCRRQYRK